jgi:predicted MFS family arabinose efflux permease
VRKVSKLSEKIPSFVWVLLFLGGIALFIGALIGGFYVTTHIEWIGSIVMLAGGWGALRLVAHIPELDGSKIGIAILILFFAILGIAFDQTGNFIYNEPMRWIFCPARAELARETVYRALNDGVSVDQNFKCVADGGRVLREISGWGFLLFRLFEYVLIGYLLLGLSRLYTRLKVRLNRK